MTYQDLLQIWSTGIVVGIGLSLIPFLIGLVINFALGIMEGR